jgi:hypothetical protein
MTMSRDALLAQLDVYLAGYEDYGMEASRAYEKVRLLKDEVLKHPWDDGSRFVERLETVFEVERDAPPKYPKSKYRDMYWYYDTETVSELQRNSSATMMKMLELHERLLDRSLDRLGGKK